MIRYDVISKAEIPHCQSHQLDNSEHYGEWVAIARTFKLCDTTQALRIDAFGISHAAIISSLHGACRKVGIRITTLRNGNAVYVTKIGETTPEPTKEKTFVCKHCRRKLRTFRPRQKWCSDRTCQEARRREIKERLAQRKKALKNGAAI